MTSNSDRQFQESLEAYVSVRSPTAGCGDIDPYTPCMYGWLSNPSSGTLCVPTMRCGSITLKSAVVGRWVNRYARAG